MMIVVFNSMEDKVRGLIGMKPIPDNTLFIFKGVRPGDRFHSKGVLERFDIAFLNRRGTVLSQSTMIPPASTTLAPSGARVAIESTGGLMKSLGIFPGKPFHLLDGTNLTA